MKTNVWHSIEQRIDAFIDSGIHDSKYGIFAKGGQF